MSTTSMLTSNALAAKKWELETTLQQYQYTAYGLLEKMGAIYVPKEIGRGKRGDQTTFAYAGKLTSVPVGEGGTLIGNGEALDLNSHSMTFNVSRIAVENPAQDTIEQSRTNVQFDSVAMTQLKNRCAELLDTSIMYQLAGANPTSLTINGSTYSSAAALLHVQGHNTPVAPTSERIVRAGGAANDQSLTSSNRFTLDLLDAAMEAAALSDQPLEMFDDNTFVCIISPEQEVDLKRDSAGKVQWFALNVADKMAGKEGPLDNRFLGVAKGMRYLGMYGSVHVYVAPRVAYGVNASNSAVITTVRRAVMVGKNALSYASMFGKSLSEAAMVKFFEQESDHGYYVSDEARMIYGVKKMTPSNKQDIGVIVISTYAAAHTA
ncbi:Protein of unknown function DUF4043 [uncultured Caudovirales phage]|uniref:Major capsid protein n=1 Tax=uncultured Caudovirales phage TaxID=2100421 RepID=A0A6J5P011_9CAUD|nr:Protein of unknown function DUF4043 [uncultured Caudovirales phage]